MTPDTDLYASSFFLADHADSVGGKVYVNGGFWNRLNFPKFPATPRVAVVAILMVPWRPQGQEHNFAIWFEDADGKRIGNRIGIKMKAGNSPDARIGDETLVPLTLNGIPLALPQAGDYAAVLSVDDVELSRWRFRASQRQMPAGQMPGGQLPGGPTQPGPGQPGPAQPDSPHNLGPAGPSPTDF